MNGYLARWARLGVLAVVSLGAGCWGDVEILDPEPTVSSGGAGSPDTGTGSLLEKVCEDSEVRCNDADLERCVAFGNSGNSWLKIQHCDSAALCNAETASCDAKTCSFGELRCDGAVPERCNEDLTAREQLGACPSAAYCSPDGERCAAENKQAPCCLDTPCRSGELRCNNGELERCLDDQTDFEPIVTCATQKLCELSLGGCLTNPGSCVCEPPRCEAGATRCTGATLERCNADQTDWELVDTCATEALCKQGLEQSGSACPIVPCQPGEHRCTGGALEVCNDGQTDFELVRNCPGGEAFCDAGNGVCTQAPCEVGDTRCNGAQVVSCRADQSGFDPVGIPCATPQLCGLDSQGSAFCDDPKCGINEFRCQGNQPIRCNAGRTGFDNAGAPCLRAELCDEGRQRCNFCFPGRRECTPDLRSSRTCSPDGNFFGPLTFCPLGCIAETGACQTCNLGEFRCQGGLLSRCNDGVSFTPLNVGAACAGANQVSCSGNQVLTTPCGALGCNAQRNACNQCSGTQRVCSTNTSFSACQPNGTFGPAQACGAGLLCSAGQCVCSPGQPSCSGDTLLVCNDGGTALVAGARCSGASGNVLRTCAAGELTTNTCSSAALCTAATGSTCPACSEGARTCAAGQPQVCTGGQFVPATACAAGFACEGAGLCRCTAGDIRCTGSTLVQCSTDRASFEPAPVCAGATLRSCSGATRLPDQTCGSAALCSAASGGVCAQCLATDPVTCDGGSEVRCVGGQLEETSCDLDLCVEPLGCVTDILPD